MEFKQLEMLVAVVEEGTVQRAADRVYRTQPAVSMAIRKLEEELGVPVFDRRERVRPALTQEGRVMYGYARELLRIRDEAARAMHEHTFQ